MKRARAKLGVEAVVALLAAGVGCLEQRNLLEPPVPEGSRTAIVFVQERPEAWLWVVDLRAGWQAPRIALPEDEHLLVFAYPETVEVLQLRAGAHVDPTGVRPLPPAPWTASHEGRAWRPDGAPRPPPDAPWLPAFDWAKCLDVGGCGAPDPQNTCKFPCATTSSELPRPPAPISASDWVVEDRPGPFERPVRAPAWPAPVGCAGSSRQPYGASACAPVGPCAEVWPAPPPEASRALHVAADAAPGGDGRADAPFARLSDALAVRAPGDAILLGPGTYSAPDGEDLTDLLLIGVCAARTALEAPGGRWAPRGDGVRIVDVRLPPITYRGRDLHLEGVTWQSVPGPALSLDPGASADIDRALLRGGDGPGLLLEDALLDLHDVVIVDRAGPGLRCATGGQLSVDRLVVRGARPADPRPAALFADDCAIEGRRVQIEGGAGPGLFVSSSTVALADLHVRDMAQGGLVATAHATVTLERAAFERLGHISLELLDGAQVGLQDGLVRGQAPRTKTSLVDVGPRSALSITRAFLHATDTAALDTDPEARRLELRDVTIDAPADVDSPLQAVMLQASRVVLERVALAVGPRAAFDTGEDSNSVLTLSDVHVRGGAYGLNVEPAVEAHLLRVRIEAPAQFGIQAGRRTAAPGAPSVQVSGLLIHDCGAGPGLEVRGSARVEVAGFALERNAAIGARVQAGAYLRLEDGVVRGHQVGVERSEDALGEIEDLVRGVRFEDNIEALRVTP